VTTTGDVLRRFAFVAALAGPASAWAATAEDPTSVRAMLNAGARELALARVDALQPRDAAAPLWTVWEGLRCDILGRLNRREALLARVSALRVEKIAPGLNGCLLEAARAALGQKDPQAARAHAAKLLWHANVSESEAKAVRLIVIESYVAEERADDAFRSMLRFQQDFQPLERAVTERFAEAMLDMGRDSDALNWVRTGDSTPIRLILQLRSGVLTADAVIAQSRAALARNPRYWGAIHEAGVRSGNGSVQVEALERMLQHADAHDESAQSEAARRLWQAYVSTAQAVGNREQLLVGDDGAWADYAARRLGADAFLSRAVYAYLAQRSQRPDIRRNAQLQLAFSLYSNGLEATALRALRHMGLQVEALDEQARYILGTIAAKHNDAALARELWRGLSTPANVNAIEWQLTLARTALQAGDAAASADTVDRLLAGRASVSPQLAQRILDLGQEMLDLRTIAAAHKVYGLLVPLAGDADAREALFGLARAEELGGDAAGAAAYYLRSALLVQATVPDALSFQARLLAALNLMRAGLKDDARTQFEWLLKNAKDPTLIETARRGLSRL